MRQIEAIRGTAAGVPFTALPPAVPDAVPAPLVVTWHMMDAPRTDAAFAAALPLARVPAWRVHLGMPWCGDRAWDGGRDEAFADPMMRYVHPVVRQAAEEFPAALSELRGRFPVDGGPIGVVGGSLGGAVALSVLAGGDVPVAAAALVNAAVRARSVVAVIEGAGREPYEWDEESRAAADRLDFVAHAGRIAARAPRPPVLVVNGELDFPGFRTDAGELAEALRVRYDQPDHVRQMTVPGLAHPLAEQPGVEPAPQLPAAAAVDRAISEWFLAHLV
ncbi:alpha/beta hydrolase family protein [Microbispora sp. NPDC049125]|uniref:alpha/beta hydrolase family protein n=1 Tax=Microbispora sp. NPDC049125 TaxID=3154929 RepID=UPI003466E42C